MAVIVCDGSELSVMDDAEYFAVKSPLDFCMIEPDDFGLLRCMAPGCLNHHANAGRCWPAERASRADTLPGYFYLPSVVVESIALARVYVSVRALVKSQP